MTEGKQVCFQKIKPLSQLLISISLEEDLRRFSNDRSKKFTYKNKLKGNQEEYTKKFSSNIIMYVFFKVHMYVMKIIKANVFVDRRNTKSVLSQIFLAYTF